MSRDERFIKGENLVLSGVTAKFAHLIAPDTKYEHKWCVRAYLSDQDAKDMKSFGFNVKDSEDGAFIQLNRKCKTKAGKTMSPPALVDKQTRPFTEEVGNGSIINVSVWAKYITVNGNEMLVAYLEGVQVVDHVPCSGGSGFNVVED